MGDVRTLPRQITKQEWARLGGLKNSRLFRKQRRDGSWSYWIDD